eukprot:358628-Chlamydomonas_euryale.AAC.1
MVCPHLVEQLPPPRVFKQQRQELPHLGLVGVAAARVGSLLRAKRAQRAALTARNGGLECVAALHDARLRDDRRKSNLASHGRPAAGRTPRGRPPKPNAAPAGVRIHAGGRGSGAASRDTVRVTVKSALNVSVTRPTVTSCSECSDTPPPPLPPPETASKPGTPGAQPHHNGPDEADVDAGTLEEASSPIGCAQIGSATACTG